MPRTPSSKFAQAVRNLSVDQLNPRARRTESIKLRVTANQKDEMQQTADSLGMTLSELVVQVVEHALPRLREDRR